MGAIKIFRDLLSFLTIIPLAKEESFVETSARYLFLFPIVGGVIGGLAASYAYLCMSVLPLLLSRIDWLIPGEYNFWVKIFSSSMTVAFLLVLTGLQHFDGLVDIGNAFGLSKLSERRAFAHAWIVTYKGGIFAISVEFLGVLGLFFVETSIVFESIILSEILAKLAMVTVAWRGTPAHEGLGARFMEAAGKRRIHITGYAISMISAYLLLGLSGLLIIPISFITGLLMERLSVKLFGGVSGDTIGATNEIARAATLLIIAGGL